MKKLMIAIGAVALAVGVQAATVNWSSGAFLTPGDGGNGWSSSTAGKKSTDYAMEIFFYTDSACENLMTATGTTETKTSNARALAGSADVDGLVANTTYYTKAVITRVADGATLTSQILSFAYDGSMEDPGFNFMSDEGTALASLSSVDGSYSSTYGFWQSSGWVGTPVPEPTSGLLMLLGVAGLALRRRRA